MYYVPGVRVVYKGPPKITFHGNMTCVDYDDMITHITCRQLNYFNYNIKSYYMTCKLNEHF